MKTQKLMVLLASAALGLGLAGCAGNADASAPVPKIPTISDMDREKQVLMAEHKEKAAKDYAAKVKAEKEAKAKAEAEAAAQAAAQGQSGGAQASSGAVANRSGTSGRSYQPQARHNYRQGKARGSYQPKARPRARRGGGGGGGLSYDDIRRRSAELDRAERARNVPEKDTSGVIVCVGGNC